MDLERGSVSSSSASSPLSAADRLELEAAEALAGLAYLATRQTIADSAAKWGRKGKRLKKRVKSESPPPPPPSEAVLNTADPVQTGSDPLEEDQTKVGKQQVEMKGRNVFIESVKAEQNSESLELSHCCVARYKSTGGGRPRQNLTEAEKEARRLRRILANRESARQTIRRRQALCAELTQKAADLAQENERLKREKELALNEYQSLESTNKYLKAEMAKAIKADKGQGQVPGEVKSLHRKISGPPSTDCPFFFYNQHSFPPFCWPSMIQSFHQLQAQHGPQTATVVPSNIPMPTSSKLNSSQDPGNYININGTKSPFYLVPCPWLIPHPDHGNGFHPQPSCHLNDIQDATSVSNQFSASSTKTSYRENHNTSIDIKVEKEACGSIEEAKPKDLNVTPVKFPLDGGSHCTVVHHTENIIVPTISSTGATFVVKQESLSESDYISNVEASSISASHSLNPSAANNQEPVNYGSRKVLEAVAAAEARKRRRELTKLKNLHGKQCRMQS